MTPPATGWGRGYSSVQRRITLLQRAGLSDHMFMVLVAMVCGLLGGFGAIGFRALIKWGHHLFWQGGYGVERALALPWEWRLLAPAVGGLFVGPMVYYLAREAKGHGVPEVMEAVHEKGGVIRPRVAVVKSLASAICIASGGSVGREGPIVQIGAALSSTIGQFLHVTPRQLRTIVGCGTAAGIAATFNAPIAGALFAVEIILGDFGVTQFSPIVISSVAATVVSRHFLGNFPAFKVPKYELISPYELLPYMVMGLFIGVIAVLFVTLLYGSEDLFDRIPIPEPIKASLGGLMVGAMGIWLPHVFGVGYETINRALVGPVAPGFLLLLLVGKLVATSLTIGSGGSGGVFAPSLFMGAMAGGLFGHGVHHLFPTWTATPGAYSLVAMGAMVAGATHAPITAIIMIFELTNDYTIIPPLMAACVVSTLVATVVKRGSIYTIKLLRRGVEIGGVREINLLRRLTVADIMGREPPVVAGSTPFREVVARLIQGDHSALFVVEQGRLLGAVSGQGVRAGLYLEPDEQGALTARDLVEKGIPFLLPDDTLDVAAKLMEQHHLCEMGVVDPGDPGVLLGSLREEDLIRAYNREVARADMCGTLVTDTHAAGRSPMVELVPGYALAVVDPPADALGRGLAEVNFRRRWGVQVVLLYPHSHRDPVVPDPEMRLHPGDRLVVAGPASAVERLVGP